MADAYSLYRPQSRTALTHTNSLLKNLVSTQLAKPLNDSDPDGWRKARCTFSLELGIFSSVSNPRCPCSHYAASQISRY